MRQKKIFIVDDDLFVAALLQDLMVRNTTHDISPFTTGEECMKELFRQPDVVVLDYNLNKKYDGASNGMFILQAIKKQAPKTHVIMLSAQERYGQTIQKEAAQYVIKDKDAFEKVANMINEMQ
ncbi:MAG: response regulator [Bacteroidota bacterium]